MLAVVCSFFGVVIAVNVALAVFASQSWTGLVVRNTFVASQEYNSLLDEARRQDALGWQERFAYRSGHITFSLADAGGRPLVGLRVRAALTRPVHEGEDRQVDLGEASRGAYVARLALAAGLWNVEVTAAGAAPGAHPYRWLYRIEVPEEAAR
jgi:nitrogen fixation protein FixH